MGCWNETCGVSNMPIFAGTRVVVFLLLEDYFGWSVVPIPFTGEYDDYGWIEPDKGQSGKYKFIKEMFGINASSLRSVREKIHREELFYKNTSLMSGYNFLQWQKKPIPEKGKIRFFMVSEELLDKLTAEFTAYDYKSNSVKTTTRQQIVEHWESVIDRNPDKESSAFQFNRYAFPTKPEYKGGYSVLDVPLDEPGACEIRFAPSYRKLFEAGHINMDDLAKFRLLQTALNRLRKTFSPTVGSGSQCGITLYNKIVVDFMQDQINKELKERDEYKATEDEMVPLTHDY